MLNNLTHQLTEILFSIAQIYQTGPALVLISS